MIFMSSFDLTSSPERKVYQEIWPLEPFFVIFYFDVSDESSKMKHTVQFMINKVESGRSRNDRVEWKWQFPFSRQDRPLFRKDHHNLFHQAMPDSGQPVSIFLFLSLNNVWILLPSILGHIDFCLYAQCTLLLE